MAVAAPRDTAWERGVVADGSLGDGLPTLSILGINSCRFVPVKVTAAHIVVARVAGIYKAASGLPEARFPVLCRHSCDDILVATTKLSQFVVARYAPTEAWRVIWHRTLDWA